MPPHAEDEEFEEQDPFGTRLGEMARPAVAVAATPPAPADPSAARLELHDHYESEGDVNMPVVAPAPAPTWLNVSFGARTNFAEV